MTSFMIDGTRLAPRRRRGSVRLVGLLAVCALGPPARGGETPCWVDKGALVAPASFGDIAGDFLIDLSAPVSQLHITRANSDGVETPSLSRDLVIAGERVPEVTLVVADLDARSRSFDTAINGVLGADVLGRFTVEITVSPCRLRLSDRAPPPLARGRRLAVQVVGGRPLVSATVSDGQRVSTGLFAIDTVDWVSQLNRARLSRPLPADPASPPPPIRLRALEMAGVLFEQVPAVVAEAGDDPARGAIGMAVWSRWRLRLDMRDGWLDLTPAK